MSASQAKIVREHGLKCTPTRIRILEVFESTRTPLTTQALHALVSKSKIDLVTLYRTVESFEKAGIIRRVDLRQDSVSYELAQAHHHHIVCTNCGLVEDIPSCDVAVLVKKIARSSSTFTKIQEHTFELFGLCAKCGKL